MGEVGGSGELKADSLMVIGDGCWLQIQEQTLLEEYRIFFFLTGVGGRGKKLIYLGFRLKLEEKKG